MTKASDATHSARMFPYYPTAAWQKASFVCPQCGWSGLSDGMERGLYNELMDFSCPSCDKMLAIVGFPTTAEVRAAAAAGEPEAIEQLEYVVRGERFQERRLESQLQSPEQLPDLAGEELSFNVIEETREAQGSEEVCFVIRHDGELVWFEIAGYESWWRLPEIKKIFRAKYGSRMNSFDVEGYAYTYGDDIASPAKMEQQLSAI